MNEQGDLIFALDIGTRTVIGLIVEYKESSYEIVASHVVEHEERSMLDGQIHNVNQVAVKVRELKAKLEEKLQVKLERVAIAAAGRALKTVSYENIIELDEKKTISAEDVQALEFSAVQKAQTQLAAGSNQERGVGDYHFVGYTVKDYFLDGINIGELEGQRGRKLQVNIIATFLPQIVVDSLLSVINKAGLEVEYLTLEPIAVASVVIPRDMYNFNLALVDIGAGTSDIALTRGGAMIAFAMVAVAGDEITETLAEHYLLDYSAGEMIKRCLQEEEVFRVRNILSQEVLIKREEALEVINPVVKSLASQLSEAIMMLNRKPPQAVILVGGGSLTPNMVEELAAFLELDADRVGIKDYNDIKHIIGTVEGIDDAQVNTPLGIAISSKTQKSRTNFIDVIVNDHKYQLFSFGKATVVDALLAAEIDFRKLQGVPGMGLTCNVNGELKVIKGRMGKPGRIFLNGEEISNLETEVSSDDRIKFISGEAGVNAEGQIADVVPEMEGVFIKVNGERINLQPQITQNGVEVTPETPLEDGAEIKYFRPGTIRDVVSHIYNITPEELENKYIYFTLNDRVHYIPEGPLLIMKDGEPVDLEEPVVPEMELRVIKGIETPITIKDVLDNFRDEIRIVFNGSELAVPVKNRLYCNGEKVEADYVIQDGDELLYKTGSVSIRYVLDFINYKITPFINNISLFVNDEDANLDDFIKDGDNLKITMADQKKYGHH